MPGPAVTVSVAAVVVALETLLVKTARYWLPESPSDVEKVKVVEVAPMISVKVPPPLVLICHCTVGVGLPEAAAVKVTVLVAEMLWLKGLVVIAGAKLTVIVAAEVVALPDALVKTARNFVPS